LTYQDKVYVTDTFNHALRKYDPTTGIIPNFIGGKKSEDVGSALKSAWNELYCAAWNKEKSKIYIADLKNNQVRCVDFKTGIVRTVAGNGKKGIPKDGAAALKSPLMNPRAVAVDSQDNLYIADRAGHALRIVKPDGKIFTVVNKKGKKGRALGDGVKAQLFGPKYLAVGKDDKVWIADDQNDRICLYDPITKKLSSIIGQDSKMKDWELKRPHGVTIHKDGSIYVVDSGNNRVLKLVK
jgi:DNA-binding beta-propeller fold protein YncE